MKKTRMADLMFFLTILVWFFGSFLVSAIPWRADSYIYRILLSQILLVLPVGIGLIVNKKRNPQESVCEFLGIRKIRIATVVLFVLVSIFIRPLLTVINAISMMFVENTTSTTLVPVIGETPVWISLIMIALVPCIFEELVYRGYFYHSYRRLGFWKGVLFSSLIFGLMHMNFNQFAYAFVMGIIFCIMAEASGSIWGGVIVHFSINGSSVLMVWMLPKLQKFLSTLTETTGMDVGDVAALTDTTQIEYSVTELAQTIKLILVPTIFMTVAAAFLIYAIACLQKRKETFMGMLTGRTNGKEGTDIAGREEEQNLRGMTIRFPGVLYIVSAILCLSIMIMNTIE